MTRDKKNKHVFIEIFLIKLTFVNDSFVNDVSRYLNAQHQKEGGNMTKKKY